MNFVRFTSMLCLALASVSAVAHEFWIAPATFSPRTGEKLDIGLFVGDGFPGEPVARNPQKLERFTSIRADDGAETPIAGVDGKTPAGIVNFGQPGRYLLVFRSKHSFTSLPADKFESYLKDEGLQHIIELRKQRNQSAAEGKEAYSRCSKSLIQVDAFNAKGDVGNTPTDPAVKLPGADRTTGLKLEIVAETSPFETRAGVDFSFKVLFDGKPLPNVLVRAQRKSAADRNAAQTVRSDADGLVSLKLADAGVWLISAVHMLPAGSGVEADWESWWASLTFELK